MARHRFHGDPKRFDALAAFIYDRWGTDVQYIADVAGGQGMLSRGRERLGVGARVDHARRLQRRWTRRQPDSVSSIRLRAGSPAHRPDLGPGEA